MRYTVRINKHGVLVPGLLCLMGLAAVLQVSASSVSKVSGMGAGVLPVIVGALMMLVGILWVFNSRLSPDEEDDAEIGVSKWRASCGVASGVFAFLLLAKYAGLIPAIFVSALITILGDQRHTWRSASVLAGAYTLIAVPALAAIPQLSFSWFGWA